MHDKFQVTACFFKQQQIALPEHAEPCVVHLQENAIKVSKRLLNKPREPVQLAADVVEQALATGGDRYLETQQHKLTWWQMSLLDVKLFLTVPFIAVLTILGVAIKFLGLLLFRALKGTMKGQHNASLASKSKIL